MSSVIRPAPIYTANDEIATEPFPITGVTFGDGDFKMVDKSNKLVKLKVLWQPSGQDWEYIFVSKQEATQQGGFANNVLSMNGIEFIVVPKRNVKLVQIRVLDD